MISAFHNGRVILHAGDMLDVLDTIPENSIDAIVSDPPYHLTSIVKRFGADNAAPAQYGSDGVFARSSRGFMGKQWDGGDVAFRPETWVKVLRVLKPGGHLVAFGGDKTFHHLFYAIECAGFEARHTIAWLFGSGFPKSHNLADEWHGWGTALKPAMELIALARKPLSEPTVAANVLRWGTGALNIDATRIEANAADIERARVPQPIFNSPTGEIYNMKTGEGRNGETFDMSKGRWPATVITDGSDEVVAMFPQSSGSGTARTLNRGKRGDDGWGMQDAPGELRDAGTGSAARFFYTAKADASDRLFSNHPTVKPVDLMQWLVRMVTPPGGTVLDCFAGTGTTGHAALLEGFNAVLIEREEEYRADIARRMELVFAGEISRKSANPRQENHEDLPLFGAAE